MQRFLPALLPALVVLVALETGIAAADDVHFPPRRPGLWAMTMKIGTMTIASQSCIDRDTDQTLMMRGLGTVKKMGGSMTISGGGNHYHIQSVTKVSDHTITTSEDIVYVSDTQIEAHMHTSFNPPYPQVNTALGGESKSDSKWVGPCPVGMQPGDAVINGQKVHLLKAMPAGH